MSSKDWPRSCGAATGAGIVDCVDARDGLDRKPSLHHDQGHADVVVREMTDLGAIFAVGDPGREGLPRWTWEPRPETMRTAVRGFWRSLADRPSSAAMVAAIKRLHSRSSKQGGLI